MNKIHGRVLALILLTIVFCATCQGKSDAFFMEDYSGIYTYGDFTYRIHADQTIEIYSYRGNAKRVRVPSEINGMPVCYIGDPGFEGRKNTKYIELPDGLKKIDGGAFYNCTALKEISIPDTVTEIGACAFSNCRSLTKVKLPQNLTIIDAAVISGCKKLKEIQIPKTVKIIEAQAFAGTGLIKVTIPENVTNIERQAFAYNPKLKKITIKSKKIKYFGYRVFLTGSKSKVVIDVPDKCIKKYKRMLIKKSSFEGKMKIK